MVHTHMLTCITVNYNGADATIGLLKSLEAQTGTDFDIIVVDNDSRESDRVRLAAFASASPLRLDVIYSERNRGFSGGNNLGIRKALAQGSEWIMLINPDTVVGPTFIHELRSRLPAEPALVGLALHEGRRTAYAGIVRWLSTTLPHAYRPDVRTGYAIGAAVLAHRDVFASAGLLDERYFLYFEDAEYTMRVRGAGLPVMFLDAPVVMHAVSATTRSLGAPMLLRYHMRNALLFNRSHGPWWVKGAVPFWAGLLMLKQGLKMTVPSRRPAAKAIAAGIMDHYRGRYGII